MPRTPDILRLPTLRRLLGGYAVSGLGDWFGEIALSILVFRETGSVLAVSALWLAGRILPALIGPALTARVGHAPVPLLYAAQAGTFALLTLVAAAGAPLALLYGLALIDGIVGLTARALTKAAIVAAAEPTGVLAEANRMLNVVFAGSMVLGPALAGLAVSTAGPAPALALNSVSFVAAGLLLRRGPSAPATPRSRVSLRESVARVRRTGTITGLLAAEGATAVCFALILPVELAFVTETLGGSEADFGLVLAAWGIGAVLGGLALPRLGQVDPGGLLLGAFGLMVAGYLGMGAATGVAMVVACSLLGGIGQGLEGCAILTAVQVRTPREIQPHVNALAEAVRTAGPGIGFVLGGLVAATTTPRITYIVAGLAALLVVAVSAGVLSDAAKRIGAECVPA